MFFNNEKLLIFKNKFCHLNKLISLNNDKPFGGGQRNILNLSLKKNDKFSILIVGGSQGANIFDSNLKNSIVNISKTFPIRIFHQTSKKNISFLSDFYLSNKIENKIFSFDKNFTI